MMAQELVSRRASSQGNNLAVSSTKKILLYINEIFIFIYHDKRNYLSTMGEVRIMSILGVLGTSVGGLRAEGEKIRTIAANVANSQTEGYKVQRTEFEALLAASGSPSWGGGGGVTEALWRILG
jgi:hypothetical protein